MCWPGSRSTYPSRIRSTAAGNREFNSCIIMPPKGRRGGHTLLTDSTVFTTWSGGTASLKHFSPHIAMM